MRRIIWRASWLPPERLDHPLTKPWRLNNMESSVNDASQHRDFDRNPPVPVPDYEQTVKRVNVGYELIMTLTHSFLRALREPELHVLVVGVGGGAEIEWLLPANPGWRITGVDPSAEMLALAQA